MGDNTKPELSLQEFSSKRQQIHKRDIVKRKLATFLDKNNEQAEFRMTICFLLQSCCH